MRKNLVCVAAGVLGMAVTVLAGEANGDDGQSESTIFSIVMALIPWIIVFLFIWLVVFRGYKRTQSHQERLTLHMDRVEQKYDRIIALLERLVERQAGDEDVNGRRMNLVEGWAVLYKVFSAGCRGKTSGTHLVETSLTTC